MARSAERNTLLSNKKHGKSHLIHLVCFLNQFVCGQCVNGNRNMQSEGIGITDNSYQEREKGKERNEAAGY